MRYTFSLEGTDDKEWFTFKGNNLCYFSADLAIWGGICCDIFGKIAFISGKGFSMILFDCFIFVLEMFIV